MYSTTINSKDNDHRNSSVKTHSLELTIVPSRPSTATTIMKNSSQINNSNGKSIMTTKMSPTNSVITPNFGCFMNDGARKIDFVLVYESKRESRQQMDRRQFFSDNLIKEGLEIEFEHVVESTKILIFVKLHAPWATLCKLAEELEMKMPLKIRDQPTVRRLYRCERVFEKFIEIVFGKKNAHVFEKSINTQETILYKPYASYAHDHFSVVNQEHFFPDRLRIEIVYEILQKAHNDPNDDKKRGIEALIEKGIFETAFPLHDGSLPIGKEIPVSKYTARQKLKVAWASWRSVAHLQPLDEVRNYFGEKIGFYFAFMDFYTKMLMFPAFLGLLAFLYGIIFTVYSPELHHICNNDTIPGSYWMCPICTPPDCEPWMMWSEGCIKYKFLFVVDNLATFCLSCFTTAWSIIFLKLWKRRESRLAVDWETYDAEDYDKTVRPDYEQRATEDRQNPITSEPEKFVPFHLKSLWMTASIFATLLVLIVDAISLMILVISRIKLYGALNNVGNKHILKYNVEYARWLVHGLILIMILIFEKFYLNIAHKLTSYECPKTEKQYMTSLLWKLFIFELLNDFIPIGYAAWMKQTWVKTPLDLRPGSWMSELCDGGCIAEVAELIIVLLLARLIFGNIFELAIPYIKNAYKRRFIRSSSVEMKHLAQWRKDYKLNEVELDGVYEEYMEMMVQFAFIVLFVPAFPVASFVCLCNNILEIRIDASKLLTVNRRPVPIRAPGIQIWNRFMDIIVKVGIVCNAALIAFTSENVPRAYYTYSDTSNPNLTGYTEFSLSSIKVDPDWLVLPLHTTVPKGTNITTCYYADMRDPNPDYDLKAEVWEVASARAAVFAIYCIIFFILMWCCNTFVSDVPVDVKERIKRHQFIISTSVKNLEIDSTAPDEHEHEHEEEPNPIVETVLTERNEQQDQHSLKLPPIEHSSSSRRYSLEDDSDSGFQAAGPAVDC